jgi:hypothetical protein
MVPSNTHTPTTTTTMSMILKNLNLHYVWKLQCNLNLLNYMYWYKNDPNLLSKLSPLQKGWEPYLIWTNWNFTDDLYKNLLFILKIIPLCIFTIIYFPIKGFFLYLNKLESLLLKDDMRQVCLKLAQWFWRSKKSKCLRTNRRLRIFISGELKQVTIYWYLHEFFIKPLQHNSHFSCYGFYMSE